MTLRTLGLSELVNLTANEASEKLLGEGVVHDFAFLVVNSKILERWHAVENSLPSLR